MLCKKYSRKACAEGIQPTMRLCMYLNALGQISGFLQKGCLMQVAVLALFCHFLATTCNV